MEKEYVYMKSDTSENWEKAKNFIPAENEIIIYTDYQPNGMKIGDGKTKLEDLKFINNNDFDIEGDTLVINTKGGC